MDKAIFVSGIDTGVGKTVVSAILVQALKADYWKPVQSGDLDDSDTDKVRRWTSNGGIFHPESYRLRTPVSPHASAAIDGVRIELDQCRLPETDNFLIVEGAGGLMVPLNDHDCMIDLIRHLEIPVLLVARHYLGSINHTLLSIEALKKRGISVIAVAFNGTPNPSSEAAINRMGGMPFLRIPEINPIDSNAVSSAAAQLKPFLESWKAGVTLPSSK